MEMTEMLSDMAGMPPLQTVMEQGPVTPRPPASGCSPMSCEDKKALLHEIRVCTFALIEARLFLDSHPDDRQAIAFYRKHRATLADLEKKWENCTGEVFDANASRWTWVDTPWPWQSEL